MIGLYLRVSQEERNAGIGQGQASASIRGQRMLLQELIGRMTSDGRLSEWEADDVREFVDDGFSGMNMRRSALSQLLELCDEGAVDCVMVNDLSRLSRSYIDLGDLLEHRLPRMGVRFVSRAEGIDLPGVRLAPRAEGVDVSGARSASKTEGVDVPGTRIASKAEGVDLSGVRIDTKVEGTERSDVGFASKAEVAERPGAGFTSNAERAGLPAARCPVGTERGGAATAHAVESRLPGETRSPDEDLMLGLLAICNNYYSMQLSRSVRCSMTASWRRGEHVQPFAPFGYVFDKSSRGRLRIDPEAARCVAWMFELAAGGMRARDIARELQGAGAPTPAAYALARGEGKSHCRKSEPTPWNARKVRAILRRETYAGVLVGGITRSVGVGKGSPKRTTAPCERIRVEGAHEAIVSWEVFVAAQEVL